MQQAIPCSGTLGWVYYKKHLQKGRRFLRIALGEQIESTDRQLNLLIPQEDWPPNA